MATVQSPATEAPETGARNEGNRSVALKRGAIGWMSAAALGAVLMSPALGLYGNIGPMISDAGNISPIIFVIGIAVALLNASNYAMVSRRMPAAGSAFTWSWNTLRPRVGSWVGWMMLAYYTFDVFVLPLLFGLFFNAFLGEIGVATSYWTWALGVVLSSVVVICFAYRNVVVETRTMIGFLLVEAGVVIALAITLLVVRGGDGKLSAGPFNIGHASSANGAILALLFAIFASLGFESISSVAEETETPKSKVPQATLAAVLIVGIFWAFSSYALSFALTPGQVASALSTDVTPVASMAKSVWGSGAVIVDITGMTAALGVYLGVAVAISRMIFAQGRDGVIPANLGQLHPKHRVPWNALHVFFFVAIVGTLVPAKIAGITNFYAWTASATVFFALVAYSATAIANLIIHVRDAAPTPATAVVVPVLAVALNCFLIYKFYFNVLWNSGFALGQSITLACFAVAALCAVYVFVLGRLRPAVFQKKSFVLDDSSS